LSFGFGYETNIAGIGAPPNIHVMASEVLAHTPRQHPIACPSLTSIKITLLKSQRYDSLLAVKRWPRVQLPGDTSSRCKVILCVRDSREKWHLGIPWRSRKVFL